MKMEQKVYIHLQKYYGKLRRDLTSTLTTAWARSDSSEVWGLVTRALQI